MNLAMMLADQVPGFGPALEAVRRAGGVLLTEDAARALTLLALAVAGPHIKAEHLADMADDLAETAGRMHSGEGAATLLKLSASLDLASHQLRRQLDTRPLR